MDYKLDMSVMLTMHAALRRDLAEVARIAGRRGRNAGGRLQATLGWEQFKKFLVIHHHAEDDFLWPALRAAVAASADQAALVDALEAEHSLIEPLLSAVDAAVGDPDDRQRLAEVADELVSQLGRHLDHEETEGFALIDAALDPEEWQRFAKLHGGRLLGDAPTYVPWLLDGAAPKDADGFLAKIPPHLAASYRGQWAPRYAALAIWDTDDETTPAGAADR